MKYRSHIVALVFIAFSCWVCTASAQSGRRAAKPASPPTPVVVEPSIETPPAPKPTPQPDLSKPLVTVASRFEGGIVSRDTARIIIDNFRRQLESDPRFRFADGFVMTRDGARDTARTGDKGYVVWLELIPDTYDYDSPYRGSINYYDVIVKYSVFPPGGEGAKEGRIYYQSTQQRRRTGTMGIPRSTRGPVSSPRAPAEYTPERAGREAARRVLSNLNSLVTKQK